VEVDVVDERVVGACILYRWDGLTVQLDLPEAAHIRTNWHRQLLITAACC